MQRIISRRLAPLSRTTVTAAQRYTTTTVRPTLLPSSHRRLFATITGHGSSNNSNSKKRSSSEPVPPHEMKLIKHIIANQKVITVEPTSTLNEALHLMLTNHIRHLPVVQHGQLVGVLTDRDIRLASSSPVLSPEIKIVDNVKQLSLHRVSEAMSRNVLTIAENDTILDACKVMSMSKRGCLPVTKKNDDRKLVGIVTRSAMLDHLIRLMEPLEDVSSSTTARE